jgi:hypothetical protein
MTFVEADSVHQVALVAAATRETVAFPVSKELSHFVRDLSVLIKEVEDDFRWVTFIRRCRRTLRDVITTPLAPDRRTFEIEGTIDVLEQSLAQLRGGYPSELIETAEYCLLAMGEMSLEDSNPAGDRVCEILATGNPSDSGLLVLTRHIEATKSWLANKSPGTRLLTPPELSAEGRLETLVVLGPTCWFPAYVLSSPRAESIAVVHFDWLRDRPIDTNLLASSGPPVGVVVGTAYRVDGDIPHQSSEEFDAELLLPRVDWERLAKATSGLGGSIGEEKQFVEARLFLLAGGYGVYLEALSDTSIDSVEFEGRSEPRLRRKPTIDVTKGDYVVLRSFGGTGDYIADIADEEMGRRAPQLRKLQREWKSKLRDKVESLGVAQVERQLKGLGVVSPHIRYRLLRQSIKSQKSEDFRILMEYIGLGDQSQTLWAAMEEIHGAHIAAGQKARSLLEAAVLRADLTELIQYGRINVSLSEIDAGALGVFRVEECSPNIQMIDEDDLRVLRQIEDDLWQG